MGIGMEEIWKTVSTHDGYEISNIGRVRSKHRIVIVPDRYGGSFARVTPSIILKGAETEKGYIRVALSVPGRRPHQCFVHRLVAMEFIEGRTEERNQVNHKDGAKSNNSAENLEWVSCSENLIHSFRVLGRVPYQTLRKIQSQQEKTNEL